MKKSPQQLPSCDPIIAQRARVTAFKSSQSISDAIADYLGANRFDFSQASNMSPENAYKLLLDTSNAILFELAYGESEYAPAEVRIPMISAREAAGEELTAAYLGRVLMKQEARRDRAISGLSERREASSGDATGIEPGDLLGDDEIKEQIAGKPSRRTSGRFTARAERFVTAAIICDLFEFKQHVKHGCGRPLVGTRTLADLLVSVGEAVYERQRRSVARGPGRDIGGGGVGA